MNSKAMVLGKDESERQEKYIKLLRILTTID
jgi:hypothetical protein